MSGQMQAMQGQTLTLKVDSSSPGEELLLYGAHQDSQSQRSLRRKQNSTARRLDGRLLRDFDTLSATME